MMTRASQWMMAGVAATAWFLSGWDANAQLSELRRADRFLEHSLTQLHESTQKISANNSLIAFEIEKYQSEIRNARHQLELLDQEHVYWSHQASEKQEQLKQRENEILLHEKTAERLLMNQGQLAQENSQLEQRIQAKQEQKETTQEAIERLKSEIIYLSDRIDELKNMVGRDFESSRNQLKERLQQSRARVREAQKEYRALEKNSRKPLSLFRDAKDENLELLSHAETIQQEFDSVKAQEQQIMTDIANFNADHQNSIAELDRRIQELAAKKRELESVLREARLKIDKSHTALLNVQKEAAVLEENLLTVKEENKSLKEEVRRLEAALEELTGST